MRKVRITVLKKGFEPELAKVYGVAGISECPCMREGQIFDCVLHRMPKGFCEEAWKCMQHYAYGLYHGSDLPFGHDWMREPGVVIATCNDGLRPVTFKLERVEEPEE